MKGHVKTNRSTMMHPLIEPHGDGRALVHPDDDSDDVRVLSLSDVYSEYGASEVTELVAHDSSVTIADVPNIGSQAVIITSEQFDAEVAWPIETSDDTTTLVDEPGYLISGGRILCPTTACRHRAQEFLTRINNTESSGV